jgi:hypothetical protein
MLSVPITLLTLGVGIPLIGRMDYMQHYVIKYFSDLWQVGGFLRVLRMLEFHLT